MGSVDATTPDHAMTAAYTRQTAAVRGHLHGWHDDGGPNCTDVSADVCLRVIYEGREQLEPCGFIVSHDRVGEPDAPRCEGVIHTRPIRDADELWTQEGELEAGNLTLSPSVICPIDSFHGWVRNGRWEPA